MQKTEKTDELKRGFESLSNRHILKGFKCVSKKLNKVEQKQLSLPSLFQ